MTSFQEAFYTTFRPDKAETRLRIAPTPSGYLHLGNGINFVLNWLAARITNGHLMLRIDDLDADRKRPEYVQDVFDTLHWMGITWDDGPQTPQEFETAWSNRHRMAHYHAVLSHLVEARAVYACAKSRKDLQAFSGDFPPEFRQQGLSLHEPDTAWRALTPPGFPLPDFVVRRRDGIPAYQIASLTDDLLFKTTHIIRGADLQPSTAAQQWIAETLSNVQNADFSYHNFLKINFLHHPLIEDESGHKLSKSAGSTALKTLREQGKGAETVFAATAKMLGLPEEAQTAAALLLACQTRNRPKT
jgi:glutamyl-tRNA synthetase